MKSILCFGDSNTFGYDTVKRDRFPWGIRWTSILQEQLGKEYHIIEEGMNGRTTVWDDPIENLQSAKTYLLPCLASHWPLDLVILMLGTNDLKSRYSLEAHDIAAGVETLALMTKTYLQKKQEKEVTILIVSPIEIGEKIEDSSYNLYMGGKTAITRSRQFPKYYEEIAKKHGFQFLAASKYADSCQEDSMHMDAENHKKLAKAIKDKVLKILS